MSSEFTGTKEGGGTIQPALLGASHCIPQWFLYTAGMCQPDFCGTVGVTGATPHAATAGCSHPC